MSTVGVVVSAGCAASALVGMPRWLRVAQRERYVGGSVSWTRQLWLSRSPASVVLFAVSAVVALLGLAAVPVLAIGGAAVSQLVPVGLPWRGRTSALHWTPRLRRVAVLVAVLVLVLSALAPLLAVLAALLVSALVDVALFALAPLEARRQRRHVRAARAAVDRVRPTVVAITGSYGTTATQKALAHLLAGRPTVVAAAAGAVADDLAPGTEVLVVEGESPGTVEGRCASVPPDIAVITAVGEAHLRRLKTREAVLAALLETTETARSVVIDADEPLLRQPPYAGKTVVRCSAKDPAADVALVKGRLRVRGRDLGPVALPGGVDPTAVALALGACLALGDDLTALVRRLADLPAVLPDAVPGPGDTWVLDDPAAHPVSAAEALRRASRLAKQGGGRLHVVTPGLVELGRVQEQRNTELAQAVVAAGAATLVVVGRTNRAPLLAGAKGGRTEVLQVRDRAAGARAVEGLARAGDVVLFENDLADHYP